MLLRVPGVTDTWQDEMYYNEQGHTEYYGIPYIVAEPDDLVGPLKCFPDCQGDQPNIIVPKAPTVSTVLKNDGYFYFS